MASVYYHTVGGKVRGETGATRRDYLTDALGSVTGTVDQSSQVENVYRYKPYGGTLYKTGSAEDPRLRWTGDTGSRTTGDRYAGQYNRARHYGTEQGQWTTVDPLWPEEPAYGYVRGKPVDWVDPSGLGDVITNKQCKSGCDQLFRKSSERSACYYICEHRSGSNRDCSALRRYCKHLCDGHSVDKKEYCGPCKQLLGALCPPPSRQVPEPLPGRQRAPQEFTVPKRSDWSQRDLEGCFACRWSLMPIAGRMVEVCARLGGPILIRF